MLINIPFLVIVHIRSLAKAFIINVFTAEWYTVIEIIVMITSHVL